MKNLQNYYLKCLKELSDLNMKPGNIRRIYVNDKLKSTWGKCYYKRKDDCYEIAINPILVQDDTEDGALKNTIMHEILHTFEGALNHGPIWKKLANKINSTYPEYNIKRTTSSKEKKVNIQYKYTLICQDCGNIIGFHKKCGCVRYPNAYRCIYCGGKFKLE